MDTDISPEGLRTSIVTRAREIVLRSGMAFSSCREGFSELNTSLCDGTEYCRRGLFYD